ncbi:hypothetical protein JCM6882_009499 [Rhodosporidiobolus microsporus]
MSSSALYGRRLRSIPTPCPGFCPFSPRVASIIGTGLLSCAYLAWSIFLWSSYGQINKVKDLASGSALSELVLMSRYANFAGFFAATMTLVCFGSFVVSCFPQRDFAKWLSRTVWIGWLFTWAVGIFGVVVYVSSDAFLAAGCNKGDECWKARQGMQIWLIVALFITLILVFWFGVVFSAFVHTLHPHLFMSPDSDSEDEYSDYEAEKEAQLLAELRASNHPYASDAIANRAMQRSQMRAAMAGYDTEGLRQRSASRSRPAEYSDDDMLHPAATVALSTGKRSSRRGETAMLSTGKGSGRRRSSAAQHYSDDSEESGSEGSDEAEQQEKGLIAGSTAPSSSSSRRRRGRPTSRQLSAIESASDGEEEEESDGDAQSPPPPSYRSRSRGRSGSGSGRFVSGDEEMGLARRRSRSRGEY